MDDKEEVRLTLSEEAPESILKKLTHDLTLFYIMHLQTVHFKFRGAGQFNHFKFRLKSFANEILKRRN